MTATRSCDTSSTISTISTASKIRSLITDTFDFMKDFLPQNIYETVTSANAKVCLVAFASSSESCFYKYLTNNLILLLLSVRPE